MAPNHKNTDTEEEYDVSYITNPSERELRTIALKNVPCIEETKVGSLNKITRQKARRANWTYIIDDEKNQHKYSSAVINPKKASELIERQKQYIESTKEIIAVEGYLGIGKHVFPCKCLYTPDSANVAAMQKILLFPRFLVEDVGWEDKKFKPLFTLVYTGGCLLEDIPGSMSVLVDLKNLKTYVIGSDYFGESKKGILRMLNEYVYRKGGLVLHAGAKLVKFGNEEHTMAVMGLSGTGKTTTTFSKQGRVTRPIQDDMVCIWPDGSCSVTENGCFAKTFGLEKESEPAIYKGSMDASAWLENVYMNDDGSLDFSKEELTLEEVKRWKPIFLKSGAIEENIDAYINDDVKADDVIDDNGTPDDGWDFIKWTQNGRSVVPMNMIEDAADLLHVPPIESLGILNRNEGSDAAMPGIVRFPSKKMATAYFMLGETSKTSASGKERGKTRSPFTQPFFPRTLGLQADRFDELASKFENLEMWLMNTGYIGGEQRDLDSGKAMKVKIKHSSTMLEAMLSKKIKWKIDPDFGYEIVDIDARENLDLIAKVPKEILNPVVYYKNSGRADEYKKWVKTIKQERLDFLKGFNLKDDIITSI